MSHHGDHSSDNASGSKGGGQQDGRQQQDDGTMTVREAGERTAELIEKGKEAERREGGGSSGGNR